MNRPTVGWAEIEAECGGYRDGFVAVFRKYEGQPTDEKDAQGRIVKVTMASFARHVGIPRVTFQRWARTTTRSVLPEHRASMEASRARRVLQDAPLEQVERILAQLQPERRQAIAAAAGHEYAKARQEYEEGERSLTQAERREREQAQEQIVRPLRQVTRDFAGLGIVGHLEQATEELREVNADASLTPSVAWRIERALEAFTTEFQFAKALLGEDS